MGSDKEGHANLKRGKVNMQPWSSHSGTTTRSSPELNTSTTRSHWRSQFGWCFQEQCPSTLLFERSLCKAMITILISQEFSGRSTLGNRRGRRLWKHREGKLFVIGISTMASSRVSKFVIQPRFCSISPMLQVTFVGAISDRSHPLQ